MIDFLIQNSMTILILSIGFLNLLKRLEKTIRQVIHYFWCLKCLKSKEILVRFQDIRNFIISSIYLHQWIYQLSPALMKIQNLFKIALINVCFLSFHVYCSIFFYLNCSRDALLCCEIYIPWKACCTFCATYMILALHGINSCCWRMYPSFEKSFCMHHPIWAWTLFRRSFLLL